MKYPAGTEVILVKHPKKPYMMAASIGATAVLTEDYYEGQPLVRVHWLSGAQGQMDGEYFFENFKVLEDPRDVLDRKIADLQAQRAALDEVYVGDTVKTAKNNTATVKAIVGKEAWVHTKRGQNVVSKLTDLKKVY